MSQQIVKNMTPTELHDTFRERGITPYRFAQIVGVGAAAVYKWLRPTGTVPSYVALVLEQMRQIEDLEKEVARLRESI